MIHVKQLFGIICWKKNDRIITFRAFPLDLTNLFKEVIVYTTPDHIRNVWTSQNHVSDPLQFLVFDQFHFVKVCTLNVQKWFVFDIQGEYYVGSGFRAKKKQYILSNRMLIDKFTGYWLQFKLQSSEAMSISWKNNSLGIKEDSVKPGFFKSNKNWMLYFGEKSRNNFYEGKYEGVIMPPFNQSKINMHGSQSKLFK